MRMARPFQSRPDYALSADASLKGAKGVLASFAFATNSSESISCDYSLSRRAPGMFLDLFRDACRIYCLRLSI